MLKIAHLFERLCVYAARLAGFLLLALTAVVLYDVIGRQFFNTGSVALSELQWHIHGAIALLAFGYAYTRDAHVRIDVLSQNFSSRFKARLEILGIALFLTPFLLVVIWYGIDFAERSFSRGERSPVSLGLTHRWIIKSVVPLSALIALMGAWSVLLRIVAHLRGELDEPFVREGLWKS
ncbi:MAG: TRAP transporter small permease subunit [Pseudomonadota bacterium]